MCLRLGFKRDHSRDSEALRSPLNLPNDKTPLPLNLRLDSGLIFVGPPTHSKTPTHLSPMFSLSPPCARFDGRRTNDPESPHNKNCSSPILSRLLLGARLAACIMITFVQTFSYISYLSVVCLTPPVLLDCLDTCASFTWPEADDHATNRGLLLNLTAICWDIFFLIV